MDEKSLETQDKTHEVSPGIHLVKLFTLETRSKAGSECEHEEEWRQKNSDFNFLWKILNCQIIF